MSTLPSHSASSERELPDRDDLRRRGLAAGLHAVGFTHTEPFDRARIALQTRRAQGRHGGMNFTYRNPARSTDPRRIVRGAETLIVGAWPYASDPARLPPSETPVGRRAHVAAYAWREHYADLRTALRNVAQPLVDAGWKARVIADDNALVDRAAAVRAGIGWSGKNSNVLLEGRGSWYVLGAVVTDAPLHPDEPIADQCGPCRRCFDGCPTDAIVADGVIDARRCLAWLLQAPGDFPDEFREALGTRIYGCDDCQTVCPPSRRPTAEPIGDEVPHHDLFELLERDDSGLLTLVDPWYIPGRDLRIVRRNALVALGNAELDADDLRHALTLIDRYEVGTDENPPDAMLAEHAAWARRRLTSS